MCLLVQVALLVFLSELYLVGESRESREAYSIEYDNCYYIKAQYSAFVSIILRLKLICNYSSKYEIIFDSIWLYVYEYGFYTKEFFLRRKRILNLKYSELRCNCV